MKKRNILTMLAAGLLAVTITAPALAAETAPQPFTICQESFSRKDYSREAAPGAFSGAYSKELYNAIRQALEDGGEQGLPGADCAYAMVSKADYGAVKTMLSRLDGLYRYDHYVPKSLSNYWQYLDYFAVSISMPEGYDAVLDYIQPALDHAEELATDGEKVAYLNDYLCTLLEYDRKGVASMPDVFSVHGRAVKGACGTYAKAFNLLCQAAGIPSMTIRTKTHAWNLVYADGAWGHVDVSANDQSSAHAILLTRSLPNRSDTAPEATRFLQELLAPKSTK